MTYDTYLICGEHVTLAEALRRAQVAGACDEATEVIKNIQSWDEFWAHKDSPRWAAWYAICVLRARWPEAEAVIACNPYSAWSYARYVLGARWPEAEAIIMQDPQAACDYAFYVIHDRWPEAEAAIKLDPALSSYYDNHFRKDVVQ